MNTFRREQHPLLIDSSASPQNPKLRRKRFLLIAFLLIVVVVVIGTTIIVLYIEDLWPFNQSNQSNKAGIYGKYPVWGGNIQNQQISLNSEITANNTAEIQPLCTYNGSVNDLSLTGYITVDNDNHGYFGDTSGFINCIDLDTCTLIWSIFINDILNFSNSIPLRVRNTVSLYRTSNGREALIFGTTSSNISINECYAVSLDTNNGTLIWSTLFSEASCRIHGFMIDSQFAFGGLSSFSNQLLPDINSIFRGIMSKININNGEIVNKWYSLPEYNNNNSDYELYGFYSGASIWPISAIIDEYVVFGTGNLFTYPRNVQQCMLGNISSIAMEDIVEYDLCRQDMRNEHHLNWRCLEKNIYTDSIIILNIDSFKIEATIPVSGVDAYHGACAYLYDENITLFNEIEDCPKRKSPNGTHFDYTAVGPDIDPTAIATYHDINNGELYGAVGQKSGQFYVFEIPSGNVKIIKKIGPWSIDGGLTPFNMAVDEINMIAIVSIVGTAGNPHFLDGIYYKYKMADNTTICEAGSIHAIDLKTGYTIWQWIHPYGKRGDNMCNDIKYREYYDITVDGTCERAFDGTDMLSPNKTVKQVIIPPIDNVIIPLNVDLRTRMMGPVTINNDMLFISTMTGDIFIHNILNGDFIHRLQCPDYKINETHWNRAGIRSGITIFEDRIIFYCGSQLYTAPSSSYGNQVISMKLG